MSDSELVRLVFHEVDASPGFVDWLVEHDVSIAFTNVNRLFFVGRRADGALGVVEEQYGTCTALVPDGASTLYLATRYQIWRLENALPPGEVTDDGHDRLYVPQTAWTTGFVGAHHLALDGTGRLVFVNSRFSCLATVSGRLNFEPLWMPPFVSALVPEDRCRLTGVALDGGRPAFVTSASRADTPDGWRERRNDGGVVLALPDGEVLAAGLSMPHSPVLDGGRLWLTNGGKGELGIVDVDNGEFEPVVELPGLARGLTIHEGFAVVGVSRPKRGETFDGLPVEGRLARTGQDPVCGIFIVNVATGRIEHSLALTGAGPEVGDLAVLPGARWPLPLAFQGPGVEEWVSVPCAGN